MSDAERERVAGFLSDRCAEGYLSAETLAERLDRLYAARRDSELDRLVEDLPGSPKGRLQTTWHRLGEAARETLRAAAQLIEEPAMPLTPDPALAGRLGRGRLTLGRAEDCDWVVPDATVSRHHAELRFDGERWSITDLLSTNGVYLNGRRVWRAELARGDRLLLGDTVLSFEPVSVTHLGPTSAGSAEAR